MTVYGFVFVDGYNFGGVLLNPKTNWSEALKTIINIGLEQHELITIDLRYIGHHGYIQDEFEKVGGISKPNNMMYIPLQTYKQSKNKHTIKMKIFRDTEHQTKGSVIKYSKPVTYPEYTCRDGYFTNHWISENSYDTDYIGIFFDRPYLYKYSNNDNTDHMFELTINNIVYKPCNLSSTICENEKECQTAFDYRRLSKIQKRTTNTHYENYIVLYGLEVPYNTIIEYDCGKTIHKGVMMISNNRLGHMSINRIEHNLSQYLKTNAIWESGRNPVLKKRLHSEFLFSHCTPIEVEETMYNETDVGYIYMIQEREFLQQNDPTFKIGCTVQEPDNQIIRLRSYKKGSKIIMVLAVDRERVRSIETAIKTEFRSKFIRHRDGTEYFTGDVNEMRDIVIRHCT
jgi:hypothetical protein